jgi:TRAP-type C4-dicarboxylate transport system permease small subunit
MKKFFIRLDKTLHLLLFTILAVMSATVAFNVFSRFIIGKSFSWCEEVAKILLVYLTFFGAAYAMKDNSHYAFEFLVQKAPPKMLKMILFIRWMVILLMSAFFFYSSVEVTIRMRGWIMPATSINRALVYGAAPLSTLLLILYASRNFIFNMKNPKLPHHSDSEMQN